MGSNNVYKYFFGGRVQQRDGPKRDLKKFLLKGTKRCFRGPIKLDLGVQKIGKASERMLAENTWVGGVSGLQFIGFKS